MTAFSEDGLSAISTKFGTLLMLDSYISDMCMQSWGRSSYARAMIELRADVKLKDNIVVPMPKLVATRGVPVAPTVSFKSTKQVYTPVSNKNGASTGGKKKQVDLARQESAEMGSLNVAYGSSSNNPIIDKIDKLEHQIIDGKLMFVDNDENPLVHSSNVDNESEVEVVFDETTNLLAPTSSKGGNDRGYVDNSLLE
ncbi:hypothetical protein Tco_0360667 [Tanacetum coccineum]